MSIVSVIIPVFNTNLDYLLECFNSIKNQDYKDIEVIIVDDGSDKKIARFLDKYTAQMRNEGLNWSVLHQDNTGLSGARNSGYAVARGKYIQFLDSDDYFNERLISSSVRRAEYTGADIVIENYIVKDYETGKERVILNEGMFPDSKLFQLSDLRGNKFKSIPYNVWSKLFRKDFLDNNNIHHNNDLRRAEDVLFTCSALLSTDKITFASDPYITYRSDLPTSNTKTNDRFPLDSIKSWVNLYTFVNKLDLLNTLNADFQEAMTESIAWHMDKMSSYDDKKTLASAAASFMDKVEFKVVNESSFMIAVSSLNPELLTVYDSKRQEVDTLRSYIRSVDQELVELRKPGVKLASRKFAGSLKRKITN